jgi:hypothetical protein
MSGSNLNKSARALRHSKKTKNNLRSSGKKRSTGKIRSNSKKRSNSKSNPLKQGIHKSPMTRNKIINDLIKAQQAI